MFDQLTRADRFELRALLLECMNKANEAVQVAHKMGFDNQRQYDLMMEFSSLFNSVDPLAVA
jgi:hypothetical protein